MVLIADHPYLAFVLALCIGFALGLACALIGPGLVETTAADDHEEITGIGA